MAKVMDITDKLDFDSNPKIVINGEELEVNADAETVVLVMGALSETNQLQAMHKALNLLFKPEGIEKLCSIKKNGKKLTSKGLMTIIDEAMTLVMGEDEGE